MSAENLYTAEAEVHAVFESSIEAWNRGDIDQYLAGYWDSEQTRWISGGMVIQGRDAIAAAYRARFASRERMGTLQLTRLEISVLSDTDALVYGELRHMLGDKASALVCTVHMRKAGETWLMVSDHTSTGS